MINRGEFEERFDPYFYKEELKKVVDAIKSFPNAKTLKDLKTYIKKGVFDMRPEKYTLAGIPFLRVADITFEGMNFSSTVFINDDTHQEELNTEFFPGDIVIAKIGHTIGKVSILPNDYKKYNISQNVVGIRITEEAKEFILSEYLRIFLSLKSGQLQVIRQSSHGAQPKITLDALRKIIIPIFSLSTQEEIIKKYYDGLNQKKQKEANAAALLASIEGYLLQALGITLPPPSTQKKCFYTRAGKVSGGRVDPFY
ncbi:MAG: restriction endonuclease subunit S, partial [Methylococcales bacterium]